MCNCGKEFLSKGGLWKHKQKCNKISSNTNKLGGNIDNNLKDNDNDYEQNDNTNIDKDNIIEMLLTQNKELIQLVKNGTNNTTISNISNSNNKTFNLQLFLNETCKDAMNIADFVSSIKVSLADLENTGRRGYIEGVSNIIINKLNNLEQHMRPLHCSDSKREILYIKDNDEWTKETDNKPILTKAIKTIANENIKQIHKWKEQYPDCSNSNSKKNDLFLKIVSNSMNGLTIEEGEKNINKIISKVAKETAIDK